MRIIHQVKQGSSEWLAHRGNCFNAGETAVAMGLCSHTTRTELVRLYANGDEREIPEFVRKLFNDGHEFEEIARPWAEEILGEELYPLVVSLDVGLPRPLGASFDGVTMAEDITWEHKTLNQALDAALAQGVIPEEYHPQMEQGLMVMGAERCLFMASKGTRESMRYAWYTSRPELREKLVPVWRQFHEDVENYVHVEPAPKASPSAASLTQLPTLSVTIDTKDVAIKSNLEDFGQQLRAYVAGVNMDPRTDQEFADAEAAVKKMEQSEVACKVAKDMALAQTGSIDLLMRAVDELQEYARRTRLCLEKMVVAKKQSIRDDIRTDAAEAFAAHVAKMNERLGGTFMPPIVAKFADVMKSKRTVASLREAVNVELARVKVEATQTADRIEKNLKYLREEAVSFNFLFADIGTLCLKANDDFILAVQSRVEAEKRRANESAVKAGTPTAQAPVPMPAPWEGPATFPASPVERPTDYAIVKAVADTFKVPDAIAAGWLLTTNTDVLRGLLPRSLAAA